ncbi:hypothetical protein B0H14DRAFT_3498819 [Mycena olivaceomarginata]|nr:hypothetical protein B0H14DRAFT_3498819 [Mycena olivaceomarginata]
MSDDSLDHSQSDDFSLVNTATTDNNPAMEDNDWADLPALWDISCGKDSSMDDSDAGSPHRANTVPELVQLAQRPKSAAAAKHTLTVFWKVETAAEKAVQLENDAWVYAERSEQARMREVEEKQKKMANKRVRVNKHMQHHHDRVREEKIANGWIPGQKCKCIHLADHDEVSTSDAALPELLRPRHQFKEEDRNNNKPCG